MIVTDKHIEDARTSKGGFSIPQIKFAQTKFPGKWKSQLVGCNVTDEWWQSFVSLSNNGKAGKKKKKAKQKKKVINSMSVGKADWSWKPKSKDVPKIKTASCLTKKVSRNKNKRQKISRLDNHEFYRSAEWRTLRSRVLEKYECKCMMCGRSPASHGVVIHVDHIKPRSKRPDLSLAFDNLQLLCEDCNLGKGNRYDTDYRPEPHLDDWELSLVVEAENRI